MESNPLPRNTPLFFIFTGMFLWPATTHGQTQRIEEVGPYLRPITPAWGLFWQQDRQKCAQYIRTMARRRVYDIATGGFNRHDDAQRGHAFIESGGVLVESLTWLYRETGESDLLTDALRIARYSHSHRGELTGLVKNKPDSKPYDLLLGRKTYEIFAAHFQDASNDSNSNILNNATKYVATSSLSKLEWKNSVRITGDIAAEVSRLKDQDGPLLQVHGSWQLIQTLLSHRLIDEFRLWTFPVVVGPGKRLFGQGAVPADLTLLKSATCSTGAMMSIYRRGKN